MENKNSLTKRIGNRLKELRKNRGFKLYELAKLVHLSSSLLSRVENGLTMPSIQTLQLIAEPLNMDIGFFFQQEQARGYVISRAGNRKLAHAENGKPKGNPDGDVFYETEYLADGVKNPFMIPLLVSLVKKNYELPTRTHGGQEFVYVLEGKVLKTLGEEKFILKKGDAIYFEANIPHKAVSLSNKPARMLSIHMIPGGRVKNI